MNCSLQGIAIVPLLSTLKITVVPNWTTMISKLNNSYCTAGLSQIPSSRPEGQRSNQSLQINEPRNSPLSSARMKKQMNQMTFRVNHESEPKFSPKTKSRRNRVFPPVRLNWSELVVDNGRIGLNWSLICSSAADQRPWLPLASIWYSYSDTEANTHTHITSKIHKYTDKNSKKKILWIRHGNI